MLDWALRYLAVAVVVGIGFAALQGGGWSEGRVAPLPGRAPSAAKIAAGAAPSARASGTARDAAAGDAWQYEVEAGPQGHFVIEATVNGMPVTFLVDTGASEIVLSLADARRLGFDPRHLEFSQRFGTANGEVEGAPVRLRELRVGQFSLYDLDASVNAAPLPVSLLGMSFLERLHGYRVEDRRLVLEW
jgi:clan AA aspartic protease (TIGR02281 family)